MKKVNLIILILILFFACLIISFGCLEDKTGQAVKKTTIKKTPLCKPITEICDGKDNDCDKLIDEEGVCKIQELTETGFFKYKPDLSIQEQFRETEEEFNKRMENYKKFLAGDTTIKEQDYVPITRWAGEEGTEPMTYAEYINKTKNFEAFETEMIYGATKGTGDLVYVIVDQTIYSDIETEILTFVSDLEADAYLVNLYSVNYSTPEELRGFLQSGLPDLKGVILIGNFPAAWYHDGRENKDFPMDLFYMDLDGIWGDTDTDEIYDVHSGNKGIEIWVGRIDATTLNGDIINLYQNYFYKNHLYRTQNLKLPNRALFYIDDDWIDWAPSWLNDLEIVYEYITFLNKAETTMGTDYKNRIKWDYDWVSVFVHSNPAFHDFAPSSFPPPERKVYSADIMNADPHALFYNLFACSATQFFEDNYLGGKYLFADTYGLGIIGSTKSGSMLNFNFFYNPLSDGYNLGDSFKVWFNIIGVTDPYWHYGMEILGDPTLKPKQENDLPIAEITLEEYAETKGTTSITGTAKKGTTPASEFTNYEIKIGEGLNPSLWNTTGITLANNGTTEIENGVLGTIDSTRYYEGIYLINLTVNAGELHTIYNKAVTINNIEINTKKDYYGAENISITGTARGTYFSNYIIEWGIGETPTQWFTTGITLENNGQNPVQDSLLAVFDSSVTGLENRNNSYYSLRLKVFYSDGLINEETKTIVLDYDYKTGWPIKASENYMIYGHPILITDLTNDGTKEIVFQETSRINTDSKIRAIDFNGNEIEGWPYTNSAVVEEQRATASAGDLDGDGNKEILFSFYNELVCFSHDGDVLWRNSTGPFHHMNDSVPIIADLKNDGLKEVIIFSHPACNGGICLTDKLLSVYASDGTLKWNHILHEDDFVLTVPPFAADVTNDGKKEIILVGGVEQYLPTGYGKIYLFDFNGNEISGWPIETEKTGPAVLIDINDDNYLEIIFTNNTFLENGDLTLHAVNYTGNDILEWPKVYPFSFYTREIITSDLDNDNNPKIIVSGYHPDRDLIINKNGEITAEYSINGMGTTRTITGNIDQDPEKELFHIGYSSNQQYLFALNVEPENTHWPKLIDSYNRREGGISSTYSADFWDFISPIYDDIDNDGKTDLVIGTDDYIYIWDFGTNYTESDWPTYGKSSERNAVYEKRKVICGDIDGSGEYPPDISDLIYLVNFMFQDGPEPVLFWTANVDGKDGVDIQDLVHIVNWMFQGGSPLNCAPITTKLKDPTKGTTYKEFKQNYLDPNKIVIEENAN